MSAELSREDARRIFGIEFDQTNKISQFGGFRAFLEYLKKSKLRERLTTILGENGARSFLQLMIGVIVGMRDMEELTRISMDPLIRKFIGNPVTETQIARNYKEFTPKTIEELHEFAISLAILDVCSFIDRNKDLTIDMDSTAVIKHGHQEGVEHGYVGNGDQTEKCYQYLFFRLHELNTFLYGTIRAGSAHSQNGISLYLRRFLPMFKRSGRQLRLRGDSGFFNEESFDICHENDTFFYIKAPMSPTRREQAASDKINWQEMQPGSGVYYASRITYTAKGTMWREVFKRQEIEDEAALFPTYRYDCVATNDLKAGDEAVFDFYNGRANIENNIREIKHDYHLGRVVTSCFTANDAITQTIMVAYILVQHFKRIALEEKDQRMQLQTLRWRLFAMPCRTISSGRAVWFRLTGIFFDERAYLRVLHKIRMTLSVLVSPPPDIVFN